VFDSVALPEKILQIEQHLVLDDGVESLEQDDDTKYRSAGLLGLEENGIFISI